MKAQSESPAPLRTGAPGGSTTNQLQKPQAGVDAVAWCDAPLEVGRRRVLIIDDHPTDVEVIARYLVREGHEVLTRTTGPSGLAAFRNHRPDLVILELMLPGLDGLAVCREIRKVSNVPIIMLTAWGSESDRVVGLECGADDYVVKPFSPRELVLRVAGLLRRTRASPDAICDPPPLGRRLVDGELTLDLPGRTVHLNGEPLALTNREFDLLSYLVQNAGEAFTREQLMAAVWGWTFGDGSTVTVHVRRLREKIEPQPAMPVRIATVWGIGYRYHAGLNLTSTRNHH